MILLSRNRYLCIFALALLFLESERAAAFHSSRTLQTSTLSETTSRTKSSIHTGIRLRTGLAETTSDSEELLHRELLAARLGATTGTTCSTAHSSSQSDATASRSSSTTDRSYEAQDGVTAYVGNLPYDAKEAQIRELFGRYGTVTRVFMPKNRETGRPRGMAFVSFCSRDEMLEATAKLDQSEFLGRLMYCSESIPKGQQPVKRDSTETKYYVGNVSVDTTKEHIFDLFDRIGTVRSVYVPLDRETKSPRGFAFVSMAKEDASADIIRRANGQDLNGNSISVRLSLPKGEKMPRRKSSELRIKLYVGNLSFQEDRESVRALFESYGTVYDCYLPLDRESQRSRGFAFVTMESDAAMRACDELDAYERNGRVLVVNEAQPKGANTESSYATSNGRGDNDSNWFEDDSY